MMMREIDFEKTKPYFVHGDFKWYVDPYFNEYIKNVQAENLPAIDWLGCFVVKGSDKVEYVLINDKQQVIDAYPYSSQGHEQMEAKINIIKISKHFDDHEKENK